MFDVLSEKLSGAFRNLQGKGKITETNVEETLRDVRTALLEADVNFKVVKNFSKEVHEKALGQKVVQGVNPGEQFVKIVQDELTKIMGGEHEEINWKRPPVIPLMIVGLNGAGKTTFAGKLALFLRKKEKKDVLLIPADTYRPAAKEQLLILAKNIGIDYFDSDLSMTPKEIVLLGLKEAKERHKEVVIIDTAGRLHVDEELMGELAQIKEGIKDLNPEILLVADAMTGQEASNVALSFHQTVGLTGIVLSKMDSDARGGAALSIKAVTGIPIRYISIGEKMRDLELFHPDRLAGRILDMGDIVSLVEKAQEVIDEKEAERMVKRLEKNKFTINDFISQMNSVNKLGSMSSLMKMIPGMGGLLRNAGDLTPAEDELKKMKVLISSMTNKERENDSLIDNDSRKKRIASGSGTTQKDVKEFLTKFRQMRKMMGGMMGMMKRGQLPGGLEGLLGGSPEMAGGPSGPVKGFRTPAGKKDKAKKKGKRRGPWGGRYF